MVHSRMFILKEARSRPWGWFYIAFVDLENRMKNDLLYEEIEEAVMVMCRAYKAVQDSHWAYLAARDDSDEKELIEDPEDTEWMSLRKNGLIDVLV